MIIFNDISDTIRHLAFASIHVKNLDDFLSNENNVDEQTIAKNLKVIENAINFSFNQYLQARNMYSKAINDILPQIEKLESDFTETMNLLHPLSATKISKLQSIIGGIQELIVSKIPTDSEEYKHLQQNFPKQFS